MDKWTRREMLKTGTVIAATGTVTETVSSAFSLKHSIHQGTDGNIHRPLMLQKPFKRKMYRLSS